MLVLSRKENTSLVVRVGKEEIVITYLGRNGSAAKLGIEAPKHCHILRGELLVGSGENGKTQ